MDRTRLILCAAALGFAAALGSCSDGAGEQPEPSCDVELDDGSCAGVRWTRLCAETYCQSCPGCKKQASCGGKLHHVDAGAGAGGDGSSGKPFREIADAASKAKTGDCILVTAGSYAPATLAGGVSLLGQGAATVTIKSQAGGAGLKVGKGKGGVLRGFTVTGDGRGLALDQVDGLHVEQVRVDGVREVAIDARQSLNLALHELQVRKTRASTAKKYGVGLVLAGGTTATVSRLFALESAAQGVLASESSIALSASAVQGSGIYGVAVDCSVDAACKGALASTLSAVLIEKSGGVGLWFRGGKLTLKQSEIGHTKLASGVARGIELQAAAVEVTESEVHHGEGVGVLINDCSGKLVKNAVTNNQERGIWIQCAKPGALLLQDNTVTDGKMVGVGSLGCTGLKIKGGTIARIKKTPVIVGAGSVEIGDGIQLLNKSDGEVSGVKVEASERVGLLIDDAVGTITNNTIDGAAGEIVVQNAQTSSQTISNNKNAKGQTLTATTPSTDFGIVDDPVKLIGALPVPLP